MQLTDQIAALALDDASVYLAMGDSDHGTVMKVAVAGGAFTQLAHGLGFPQSLAIDSTSVHWADDGGPGRGLKKLTPK